LYAEKRLKSGYLSSSHKGKLGQLRLFFDIIVNNGL